MAGFFNPFTPNGKIKIYRFVPLDESYQNTLHFKDRDAQLAYFRCTNGSFPYAKADCKASFSGQTFTRNERQYVRVEGNACNYYDCNYMAFQNLLFGEMWFFAFIHTVEYVNDYCTEIYFELDVMQSFMWNYELRECYVVREHSLTDKVGDSLTEETIPNVAYKTTQNVHPSWFDNYSIILTTTCDMADMTTGWEKHPSVTNICGIPHGGSILATDQSNIAAFQNTLQLIAQNASLDAVVSCYLFPTDLISFSGRPKNYDYPVMSYENNSTIDGYKPANNKMFTYPYTVIQVDTPDQQQVYKPELFEYTQASFSVLGVIGTIPQILIIPLGYDDGGGGTDYTRYVYMNSFCNLQVLGDNFSNWFGQNFLKVESNLGVDATKILAGAAVMAGTEGALGSKSALEGIQGVMGTITEVATAMHVPPTKLTNASGYGLRAAHLDKIAFKVIQPTKEGAQIIDDRFTMYGYATHRVKVPNIRWYDTCRPHFNYIQCKQMSFHWELFTSEGKGTSVPQRYMSKILEIYQNGITFWKNPNEVGRYENLKYDNRPQGAQ